MEPVWLFWGLLLVLLLAPLLRQRHLEQRRRRLREAMERERGSRVIVLAHRQETMSLFGIPLMRYIDIQDAEEIIRAILQTEADRPIDLILHTPGGLALPSLQIARALSRHRGTVTAFVPHYAMSGGTVIALAADRIVIGEHAVMGPIDPQIGEFPAVSLLRALQRKEPKDISDEMLVLADQAELALDQLRKAMERILGERMPGHLAEHVTRSLLEGQWTHDYPITPEELNAMGLEISTELPNSVLAMMALYPQPMRRTPSVEYGRRGGGERQPSQGAGSRS